MAPDVGRIVVTEFVSVDGVMEDPGGSEDFQHGGWALAISRGDEGDRFKLDELREAEAQLLGRVTYEGFAAAWPSRTDEAGFAEKMNTMPKYVVSSTLGEPEWQNTTVLRDLDEVARLRDDLDGTILVAGSRRLVQALLDRDLVDELRLMVFPIVLGSGQRLFGERNEAKGLSLRDSRAVGDGVLILVYERAE
jgi:dihydrofolate reductase